MTDDPQPPFGAFAPGPAARVLRAAVGALGGDGVARLARSLLFSLGGFRARRPFDVEVFGGQRVRLHGYDNLSEKRVLRSERLWDARERAFVAERAESGRGTFRFLDVGANAGLYTLSARNAARLAGRPFRAVAVEPQPEMLKRLRFNLAASGAEAEVIVCAWAASSALGTMMLDESAENRGEARAARDSGGVVVEMRVLSEAAAMLEGPSDVMKIDIEGQEAPVLAALFDSLPAADWPRAIVIEAADGEVTLPGPASCLARGYRVAARTRMNVLLLGPET